MVHIEQRALGALEQDRFIGHVGLAQQLDDVGDHRPDLLGMLESLVERLLEIDRRLAEIVLEHEIMKIERLAQLGGQQFAPEQIGYAHRAPGDLVFVGRADAAPGGPDGGLAARGLACLVECDVIRKDQRTGRADPQLVAHRHAAGVELGHLLQQGVGRQHHAVADIARHAVVQNPRRNQPQNRLLAVDDERMPGVVAALKAHDVPGAIGEQIDDLALALIAPLAADDDDPFTHDAYPCSGRTCQVPSICSRMRSQPEPVVSV